MPKTYAYSFFREGPYFGPCESIEAAKQEARDHTPKDAFSAHRVFIGRNEMVYPDLECRDLLEKIRRKMDLDGIPASSSYLTDLTRDEKVMLSSLVRDALRRWADLVGERAVMHVVIDVQEYVI